MLCCICKEKEASVHLTQICGENVRKADLCEGCAKAKGVNDSAGFSSADALLAVMAAEGDARMKGGSAQRISD